MDVSLFGRKADADDDYFDTSDDDDIVCSSKYISSDEDDEKFFLTPRSRNTSKKASKKVEDEEDDFEREMATELSQTMQNLASTLNKSKPKDSASDIGSSQGSKTEDAGKKPEDEKSEFYDDIYFDSDDSDIEAAGTELGNHKSKREKRRILTNDELFYDPTLDDQDQEWVNKMRRSYQPKKKRTKSGPGTGGQPQPLPRSDAVLNCPACLTTLCMDCQRHEVYHNQYRAMFVFNCNVDMMESLRFPRKGQKKRDFLRSKRKNKVKQSLHQKTEEDAQSLRTGNEIPQVKLDNDTPLQRVQQENNMEIQDTASSSTTDAADSCSVASPSSLSPQKVSFVNNEDDDEVFHSVTCKICNTKVAVYDKDEVYHFFNVVTSY